MKTLVIGTLCVWSFNTYLYNQEMYGLFVNRSPLLLLYRLPVLKSFRVL